MLKFLSQVYIRSDKDSLEKLAETVAQDALKKSNDLRKKHLKTFDLSSTITLFETDQFLAQCFEAKKRNIFVVSGSVIASSLLFSQQYEPEILSKTLLNDMLFAFPIVKALERAFVYAGMPSKYLTYSVFGTFSLAQVISLRVTHGFHSKSIIDLLASSTVIAGLHWLSYLQLKAIREHIRFIPMSILALPVVYLTRDIVQRVGVYGIENTINYLIESAVSTWIKLRNPTRPQPVPYDFEIPEPMICPICHDMLVNPVECLGFFFCEDCLYKWVNENHTHPSTGESISNENINKCVEMNTIITQYRKIMGI